MYFNLQLYADNGRLGLRGVLLLLSMELLAERVIVYMLQFNVER